jgi:hypothetical protein
VLQTISAWASIAGVAVSVVGLVVVWIQAHAARVAADQAASAAEQARSEVRSTIAVSDLSACAASIGQIQVFIRTARWEGALVRVGDLMRDLNQLKHASIFRSEHSQEGLTVHLGQLGVIAGLLEERLAGREDGLNTTRVNQKLSRLTDFLNEHIGHVRMDT